MTEEENPASSLDSPGCRRRWFADPLAATSRWIALKMPGKRPEDFAQSIKQPFRALSSRSIEMGTTVMKKATTFALLPLSKVSAMLEKQDAHVTINVHIELGRTTPQPVQTTVKGTMSREMEIEHVEAEIRDLQRKIDSTYRF